MADVLGRTVVHRHLYSRVWGLGDRKAPTAFTPALVLMHDDEEIDAAYAVFRADKTGEIPAILSLTARAAFMPPHFEALGPNYRVSIGHVLPPSLEDANAGETQGTSMLLPVSWQRMHHDDGLMDDSLSPEIIVLTDAVQLANQQGKLAQALISLKHRFPGALIWTPGLGGPDNIAALAWMGVDLFDLARCHQAVASQMLLTQNGPRSPLDHEDCSISAQLKHMLQAIDETRAAIAAGTLATLAVRSSLSSPRLVEHLRIHQRLMSNQEGVLSSHEDATKIFECYSPNTFDDPLVLDWVQFITEKYSPPPQVRKVMILLPCSARKPYRLSKSHGQFIEAIQSTGCHEVMMTSPLGLVPRDLEDIWPAANYDVPVTGNWSEDEVNRVCWMLKKFINRGGYQRIINHTNLDLSFLEVEVVDTRDGEGATAHGSLQRLSKAVAEAKVELRLSNQKNSIRLLEHYKSIARKTTGTDAWLDGAEIRGKLPRWRVECDGVQIAQWSIERNGFSFSRAAIPLLHQHHALKEVELLPDSVWKGDIFLQNVAKVDPSIRKGDDIRVLQHGECVGIARALAPGWEWKGTQGSLAKSHQRR